MARKGKRHVRKYVGMLMTQTGVPEDIVKTFVRTPEGRMKERKRRGKPVRPAYPALSKEEKADRIRRQGNCCAYCGRIFGSEVTWRNRQVTLKITWDHFRPYSKFRDHEKRNLVACCHVCQGIKGDRTFNHISEVRAFVAQRWTRELERQAYKRDLQPDNTKVA